MLNLEGETLNDVLCGTKVQVASDDLGGHLVLMQLVASRMALRTGRAAPHSYRLSGNGRCFDCAVLL